MRHKIPPLPDKGKIKSFVAGCLVTAILTCSLQPVEAVVGDSLGSVGFQIMKTLGVGNENETPTEDEFGTASLMAKVNYLEDSLKNQTTAINKMYNMSASTAYKDSQVKSTKVSLLSPKQVLVEWNLTSDNDCTTSSSSSNALGDWTAIESFNIYYGTSSRTSDMTLKANIPVDPNKAFYENYSYQFDELVPDTTYYFWVTSVVEGGVQLSISSSTRELVTLAPLVPGTTYTFGGYKWICAERSGSMAVLQSTGLTSGAWPGYSMSKFGNNNYYLSNIDGYDISGYDTKTTELYNSIKAAEYINASYGKGLYLVSRAMSGTPGYDYYFVALKSAAASGMSWLGTAAGSNAAWWVNNVGNVYDSKRQDSSAVVAPAFNVDLTKIKLSDKTITIMQ